MVKRVELLLNMEVREDMRADIMTEIIRPRAKLGMSFMTSSGYARSVQPLALSHAAKQSASFAQPTTSVMSAKGQIMSNNGQFACAISLMQSWDNDRLS